MRKAELYKSHDGAVLRNGQYDPEEYQRMATQVLAGTAAGSKAKLREGVTNVFHMPGTDSVQQKLGNRSLVTDDIAQKKHMLRRRDAPMPLGFAAGVRMGSPS